MQNMISWQKGKLVPICRMPPTLYTTPSLEDGALLVIENVGRDERACGPFLTLGHLEKDVCPWEETCFLSFYLFFVNLLSPPGSTSQKPDEASTAVFLCSLLGDVPCHRPLHLPGDTGLHEVWLEHPGQHHPQLAQLLVRPCPSGAGGKRRGVTESEPQQQNGASLSHYQQQNIDC